MVVLLNLAAISVPNLSAIYNRKKVTIHRDNMSKYKWRFVLAPKMLLSTDNGAKNGINWYKKAKTYRLFAIALASAVNSL